LSSPRNGAGEVDRDQHRRCLRVLREQTPDQHQIFLGEQDDEKNDAQLLGLERAAEIGRAKSLNTTLARSRS
jgi:hypothetical protein